MAAVASALVRKLNRFVPLSQDELASLGELMQVGATERSGGYSCLVQ